MAKRTNIPAAENTPEISWTDGSEVKCVYVDAVTVTQSYYGFKLHCGISRPGTPHLDRLEALLGMSPELASELHALLGRALGDHEKQYGALRSLSTGKVRQDRSAKQPTSGRRISGKKTKP